MRLIKQILLGTFLPLIVTVVLVSAAFGIGFSKSINLYPGQSLDRYFSIQNTMQPTEDLVIKVTIVEGSKYISLPEGDEFNVPKGKVVPIKVIVSIPKTARVGSIYHGKVLFKTVSSSSESDEGVISFTIGYTKSFEIEVIPNPYATTPENVTENITITETNTTYEEPYIEKELNWVQRLWNWIKSFFIRN